MELWISVVNYKGRRPEQYSPPHSKICCPMRKPFGVIYSQSKFYIGEFRQISYSIIVLVWNLFSQGMILISFTRIHISFLRVLYLRGSLDWEERTRHVLYLRFDSLLVLTPTSGHLSLRTSGKWAQMCGKQARKDRWSASPFSTAWKCSSSVS